MSSLGFDDYSDEDDVDIPPPSAVTEVEKQSTTVTTASRPSATTASKPPVPQRFNLKTQNKPPGKGAGRKFKPGQNQGQKFGSSSADVSGDSAPSRGNANGDANNMQNSLSGSLGTSSEATNDQIIIGPAERLPPPPKFFTAHLTIAEKHHKSITSLTFDKSGALLASGCLDGKVNIFDFNGMDRTMEAFRTYTPAANHSIEQVDIYMGGKFVGGGGGSAKKILIASGDSHLRVMDAQSGNSEPLVMTTKGDTALRDAAHTDGHTSQITSGQWLNTSQDSFEKGGKFLSTSLDGTCRLWSSETGRRVGLTRNLGHDEVFKTLDKRNSFTAGAKGTYPTCCCTDPTGSIRLIAGCNDGTIQMFIMNRGSGVKPSICREAHGKKMGSDPRISQVVSFDQMQPKLLSLGGDARLKLWNLRQEGNIGGLKLLHEWNLVEESDLEANGPLYLPEKSSIALIFDLGGYEEKLKFENEEAAEWSGSYPNRMAAVSLPSENAIRLVNLDPPYNIVDDIPLRKILSKKKAEYVTHIRYHNNDKDLRQLFIGTSLGNVHCLYNSTLSKKGILFPLSKVHLNTSKNRTEESGFSLEVVAADDKQALRKLGVKLNRDGTMRELSGRALGDLKLELARNNDIDGDFEAKLREVQGEMGSGPSGGTTSSSSMSNVKSNRVPAGPSAAAIEQYKLEAQLGTQGSSGTAGTSTNTNQSRQKLNLMTKTILEASGKQLDQGTGEIISGGKYDTAGKFAVNPQKLLQSYAIEEDDAYSRVYKNNPKILDYTNNDDNEVLKGDHCPRCGKKICTCGYMVNLNDSSGPSPKRKKL